MNTCCTHASYALFYIDFDIINDTLYNGTTTDRAQSKGRRIENSDTTIAERTDDIGVIVIN